MRNIAVIGAGPSGLLLAVGLLAKGYTVTVYSERTAEQILHSRAGAAPCIFDRSRTYERELGLNFWDEEATALQGAHIDVLGPQGERLLTLQGRLKRPAMAVDLRLRSARWLSEFERRGGRVVLEALTPAELDTVAARHDLVLVASGKAALSQLFERDARRSPHAAPRRNLTQLILGGLKPLPEMAFPAVKFFFAGADGEFFFMPIVDRFKGMQMGILFEAVPGGRMDRFQQLTDPAEVVATIREVIGQLAPFATPVLQDMRLTDETSWYCGAITPTVRHPVARLASGRPVMGLGDTLILNDPIAGHGANCGLKMAHFFTQRILEHGDQPFTEDWMRDTFERFWEDDGRYVAEFTNMLLEPPPPHMQQVLGASSQSQAVANRFVDDFSEPKRYWPWIVTPELTPHYLQGALAA